MSGVPSGTSGPLGGRVAVVTGASRGIGRAIALTLARYGASVCCVARDAAALEAVAGEVRGIGGKAITVAVDLTSDDAAFITGQTLNVDGGRVRS